jgi:hypothetical protein
MENWEFLLQRKGDKSWLPLESPSVEILEGAYRLAARSALANTPVAIAIAYRPLADVRHPPIQQKVVKRISHDGLLIVMPYTNLVPGLWQIDCLAAEPDTTNVNTEPVWKKTVKFDVIQVSSEAGSEWQYNEPEEDLEDLVEIDNDTHTNALGIVQTEPTPLSYSSPILDIAEQRSTELVRSMFEEFALFNDEDNEDELDSEDHGSEIKTERAITGDRPNLLEQIEPYSLDISEETNAPLQPRILLRLKQPQYIVNADNSFDLTGDVYTQGEIEVSLKNPQTLDVVVNQRFAIANFRDRNPATGAIPFSYQILVPPPSEIQVLIGEVQIHPQQDFQQDRDLFVTQQAIAVSYPASRVLPELIKEAQKYSATENAQNNSQEGLQTPQSTINDDSYPQSPQSYPQASEPTDSPSPKPNSANSLSLPPLRSNKPQTSNESASQPQPIKNLLSLPPLPPLKNKASNQATELSNETIPEEDPQSFPQVDIDDLQQIELELALTDIYAEIPANLPSSTEEPELLYSFEEELPQNYQDLLEQPLLESSQFTSNQPAYLNDQRSRNRSNRFLNKLQTLSADAIAAQKANQRTEELLLDTFPSDPLTTTQDASIDLDNPDQMPLTIAEVASFAELDLELDVELDRLLSSEPDLPDLILNEYVWEETVDPNTFPISTVSTYNSVASALSETAQTIHNIQESSPQALSEQEPIPIPEIIIPSGEIISGTPMLVTVRLPALVPKFFVKFWIKDLQTRMIVDGPRWLLDFSTVPNAEFIETRTNISIPLSSIDVAFEAIAIEAQTQRESHKVRITRAVTPPNLAQDLDFDN